MDLFLKADREPALEKHLGLDTITVPSWDEDGLKALKESEAFQSLSPEEQSRSLKDWDRMQEFLATKF